MLGDHPDIFTTWMSLVSALGIIGKQVHDARLVSVCLVHGIGNLLTFNIRHFHRMAAYGTGVHVIDPASV